MATVREWPMSQLASPPEGPENLVAELRQLISEARRQAAATVNVALTLLYWRVGDRIRRSILGSERAGYGERILATLSQELVGEFGRGFDVAHFVPNRCNTPIRENTLGLPDGRGHRDEISTC
jgi:DUF1016 N-terminal domain